MPFRGKGTEQSFNHEGFLEEVVTMRKFVTVIFKLVTLGGICRSDLQSVLLTVVLGIMFEGPLSREVMEVLPDVHLRIRPVVHLISDVPNVRLERGANARLRTHRRRGLRKRFRRTGRS